MFSLTVKLGINFKSKPKTTQNDINDCFLSHQITFAVTCYLRRQQNSADYKEKDEINEDNDDDLTNVVIGHSGSDFKASDPNDGGDSGNGADGSGNTGGSGIHEGDTCDSNTGDSGTGGDTGDSNGGGKSDD